MEEHLPKELCNIVEEYSKDNTNYNKVVRQFNLVVMSMFSSRFDLFLCLSNECKECKRILKDELFWLRNKRFKKIVLDDIFYFILKINIHRKRREENNLLLQQ